MRARALLRRYLNSDRERLINEKVHSDVGRRALKLVFIDGLSLLAASEAVDMGYSTFTDNYYRKWLPELFDDFGDEND